MPELRKQRSAEEIRRRKGIDAFVRSLGTSAVEYGKERIRDYPEEVALGWKNILGITKRKVPESLEGITPIAESVGGLAVTVPQALKQLGKSAVAIHKSKMFLSSQNVRNLAANIRRSPKEVLKPITSVKYKRLPGAIIGRNIRVGRKPGESKIQLASEADAATWFHELTHGSAASGVAGARREGKPNLKQYMSDLLESTTAKGSEVVAKTPSLKGRSFYQDQPIETHARAMAETLTNYGKSFTKEQYNRLFVNKAKQVMKDVYKKAPTLYKQTTKILARHYKNIRKMDADLLKELNIKSPKSKTQKSGLPMKTEDIIKLIKKLPKKELGKIKIKRKAD